MARHKKNQDRAAHIKSLFLQQSFSLKVIFYIGILLLVAIAISFYLTNETHEKELLNLMKLQAHRLTDTIKATIRENMIKHGSHEEIQSILEAIGDRDDIVKVSILCNGTIKASSWREDLGKTGGKEDQGCNFCHSNPDRPPLTVFIHRIYKDHEGKRFVELFNPIQNETVCYQCHPKEKQILGILNIVTSLSRLDKSIMAGKKVMIISTIIIFLLFSLEIFYFIYRFIHVPIQKLTLATRRVAAGDVDYHIEIHSADEIGELAKSFNIMTDKLKKSWDEIEAWNLELEKRVEDATVKLKQANKELKEINNRLQIADQKKTDILVTVAQDIRGPLSAIKSCAGVVLGGYVSNDPEKQKDMLKRIDMRVEELLRFSNDLLDLSLLGEQWHDQAEVDCASLIDSLLTGLRQSAGKRDINIRFEPQGGLPIIMGDKNLLSKGFLYIIENAIKYSHPKGNVSIWLSHQDGHIEFKVTDEGIGIPAKEIKCIFEPTFRGELAKKHDHSGTGVSMALVERIVTVHHGKILVKSEAGQGTKVIVSLPSGNNDQKIQACPEDIN
ncbi:MAG: ATP-binding protein [bacterium]